MKNLFKILPWLFVALFVTEIIAVMMPKKDGAFRTADFGRLPVLLNGRIQPLDSVARNSLLQIRSTGDLPLEILPSWQFWRHPKKLKSTEWLLEVMFKPEIADTRNIFLIHHPDLISELKLTDKGIEKSGLRYYSFEDLTPVLPEIERQAMIAFKVERESDRKAFERQVIKLYSAVVLYHHLKNSIEPEGAHNYSALIESFKASIPAGLVAVQAQKAGQTVDQAALKAFAEPVSMFDDMASMPNPLTVPPLDPAQNREGWTTVGKSLIDSIQSKEIHPAVGFYARMGTAYAHDDAAEFNSAVIGYKNWLAPSFAKEVSKGSKEFYFNQIKIFLHATIIYIFVFVLACGALLSYGSFSNLSETLRRSAFYLLILAFVVHTFGLIFRMTLEGRPPVTNLYSSAIFIGWGACFLGLVLERFYKLAIGCLVAGLAGFVTLLIAHNLAIGGDTMEMMQAVLDTNFWLATHVVVVTLGYASTFVAGLLAIAYITIGIFTPLLSQKLGARGAIAMALPVGIVSPVGGVLAAKAMTTHISNQGGITVGKALTKMIYAIICFAALFSFTGTVLGGIWADQSWGRFWGWDPKENGALIIVLWNVAILHARLGGMIRERGLANMAVFGNIVTAFSWFGVNMLGIGLHSYGFMDAAFKWLVLFIGSQVAIIVLGSLPLKMWKSFSTQPVAQSTPPKFKGKKPLHGTA